MAGSVREVQSSPVTVEVRGAPSLPASLPPVVGREGEDVVLSLAYCCHPPATVDWVLAGGRGGRVTLAEGGSWGRFTARREVLEKLREGLFDMIPVGALKLRVESLNTLTTEDFRWVAKA